MKFYNGAYRAIFLLNIFVISLCAIARANTVSLVITDAAGNIVLSRQIDPHDGFAIGYIHSVALTPVTDYFIVKDNDIYIDKTIYEDFGAGLPHSPGGDQKMEFHDGHIILNGLDYKLGEFETRVGRIAKHRLILPGSAEEIPLDTLAAPGKALKFSIKP